MTKSMVTGRQHLWRDDHASQAKSVGHPLVRVAHHRLPVVRQDDSSFACGPGQNLRILCLGETHIRYPHRIEAREPPMNAVQDLLVEVLIDGEAKHE